MTIDHTRIEGLQLMTELMRIIATDRCFLRHAAASDYEALVSAISAPEFPSELPLAALYRQGKLKGWLDSIMEMSVNGKACLFSVDLRTGENCIGQVSLVQRDRSASWSLAFWFHPCHWGRGFALETARAAVHHAFTVTSIEEIWAGAALWNQRSMKTLLKLGLTPIQDAGASTGKSETEGAFRTFSVSRNRWMRASVETVSDR